MLKQKEIKKIKIFFNTNGYAVIKKSIPKKLINDIQKQVHKMIKKGSIGNKIENIHYLKNKKLSSVHNISNYMPYHKRFFAHTEIHKVFYEIFGPFEKKWFNSSYFLKPKRVGIATKPHQDNAFFNLKPHEAITCWVPTTSVTKKNSSLYYYAGSHKGKLLPHDPEGNLGASLCIQQKYINKIKRKYKKHYVEVKKGDCIIHNPLVIHGSKENKSNINRGAFNFSMKSKKAKRNIKGWNDYRKKLSIYLNKRKKK